MVISSKYNTQQQLFFDRVTAEDFNQKLLLLGEAGCGKTYILVEAVSALIKANKTVVVAAPTHSALNTIKAKFNDEILDSSNLIFVTVASLLRRYGMRAPNGDTVFRRPSASSLLETCDLAVVDEISMVSAAEQSQLLGVKIPIVFTGDLSQLPVVMQKSGDWLNNPSIQKMLLVKQERQSGPILRLAQKCREKIYYPTPEDICHESKDISIVETTNCLLMQMLDAMTLADPSNYCDYRYLSYRNNEVDSANSFFHEQLFGKKPFYAGEFIMLRSTGHYGHNGQIVQVEKIVDKVYSENYKVWEYTLELQDTSLIRVLSLQDTKKINYKIEYIKTQIAQALKVKNVEAVDSLIKELELLENSYVKWQFAYASTVHKSQGQTIKNVYADISSFKRASNKRSLIYVAVSRAAEKLVVTTLPPRYEPKRKNRPAKVKQYKCTITGYISNAGGLTAYQKKRDISTENRVLIGIKQK